MKYDLARPVAVAGNTQVQGVTQIRPELEGVVAVDLGHVVDELNLPLALRQRAVALVRAKRIPKLDCRLARHPRCRSKAMPEV